MTIYAADRNIEAIMSRSPFEVVPLNKQVLLSKRVYLIDVFNTFILPDHLNLDFSKRDDFELRNGFLGFLEHYKKLGKKIGIHTDSIKDRDFQKIAQSWGIDDFVDYYFGTDYWIWLGGRYKNFTDMVKEMGVEIDDAIVIGDGESDTRGAIKCGIDLLMIPRYDQQNLFPFTFRNLIFS